MDKIVKSLTTKEQEKLVFKVSMNSLVVNLILSVGKIFAGVFGKSTAMVSDGIHSASDVFSTVVVLIGFKMASKEADDDHQYGHERIECVAAIILAIVLGITGAMIGYQGVLTIVYGVDGDIAVPTTLALYASFISIIVKEGMYWYTRNTAKIVNSGAMMADAWHHRSDALSSVGSFIGVAGSIMGFPLGDSIASVVISFLILKASIEIFKDATEKMLDTACDVETTAKIKDVIISQSGVVTLDKLQTRLFGSKMYVDVEIGVQEDLTLKSAHDIAQSVHNAIENEFSDVKHCMVHVNPVCVD